MCFAWVIDVASRVTLHTHVAPTADAYSGAVDSYLEHAFDPTERQTLLHALAQTPTLAEYRIRTRNTLDASDLFLHPDSVHGRYLLVPENAGPLAMWPVCTVLHVCVQLSRRYKNLFWPSRCSDTLQHVSPTVRARAAARAAFRHGEGPPKDVRHKLCCHSCGKQGGTKFRVCGGCSLVRYCSQDCQREHWRREHSEASIGRKR